MSDKKAHAFTYLDTAFRRGQGLVGQQDSMLQQAIQRIMQGYGGAIGQVGRGERSARQGAIDQGAQTASGLQSDAIGRGLYNTSSALGQQRGVSADTTRALSDITARFSGMKSGLMAQQGQALAGIQGQRAGLFNPLIQGGFGIGQQQANYRLQTRGVGTGPDWMGIAELGGQILGEAIPG